MSYLLQGSAIVDHNRAAGTMAVEHGHPGSFFMASFGGPPTFAAGSQLYTVGDTITFAAETTTSQFVEVTGVLTDIYSAGPQSSTLYVGGSRPVFTISYTAISVDGTPETIDGNEIDLKTANTGTVGQEVLPEAIGRVNNGDDIADISLNLTHMNVDLSTGLVELDVLFTSNAAFNPASPANNGEQGLLRMDYNGTSFQQKALSGEYWTDVSNGNQKDWSATVSFMVSGLDPAQPVTLSVGDRTLDVAHPSHTGVSSLIFSTSYAEQDLGASAPSGTVLSLDLSDILTDQYPSEIRAEYAVSGTGSFQGMTPNISLASNSRNPGASAESAALPDGDYVIRIRDSYGDGMLDWDANGPATLDVNGAGSFDLSTVAMAALDEVTTSGGWGQIALSNFDGSSRPFHVYIGVSISGGVVSHVPVSLVGSAVAHDPSGGISDGLVIALDGNGVQTDRTADLISAYAAYLAQLALVNASALTQVPTSLIVDEYETVLTLDTTSNPSFDPNVEMTLARLKHGGSGSSARSGNINLTWSQPDPSGQPNVYESTFGPIDLSTVSMSDGSSFSFGSPVKLVSFNAAEGLEIELFQFSPAAGTATGGTATARSSAQSPMVFERIVPDGADAYWPFQGSTSGISDWQASVFEQNDDPSTNGGADVLVAQQQAGATIKDNGGGLYGLTVQNSFMSQGKIYYGIATSATSGEAIRFPLWCYAPSNHIARVLDIMGDPSSLTGDMAGLSTVSQALDQLGLLAANGNGDVLSEIALLSTKVGVVQSTLGSPSGADLRQYIEAIYNDTNELQLDLKDGGRLDLILDELTAQGDTNEGKLDTAIADIASEAAAALARENTAVADRNTKHTAEMDRMGAPAGASLAADIADLDADLQNEAAAALARENLAVADRTAKHGDLKADIANLDGDLGQVKTDLSAEIAALDAVVDGYEANAVSRSSVTDGKIDTLDAVVDGYEQDAQTRENAAIADRTAKFNTLDGKVDDLDADLVAAKSSIETKVDANNTLLLGADGLANIHADAQAAKDELGDVSAQATIGATDVAGGLENIYAAVMAQEVSDIWGQNVDQDGGTAVSAAAALDHIHDEMGVVANGAKLGVAGATTQAQALEKIYDKIDTADFDMWDNDIDPGAGSLEAGVALKSVYDAANDGSHGLSALRAQLDLIKIEATDAHQAIDAEAIAAAAERAGIQTAADSALTNILSPSHGLANLKVLIDDIDADLSAEAATAASERAAIKAVVDAQESKAQADARQAILVQEHDDTQATLATMETKAQADSRQTALVAEIDVNEGKIDDVRTVVDGISTDLGAEASAAASERAAIKAVADAIEVDTTSIESKLDGEIIDAANQRAAIQQTVNGQETRVEAATRQTALIAEHDASQVAIANVQTKVDDNNAKLVTAQASLDAQETKAQADTRQTAILARIGSPVGVDLTTDLAAVKAVVDQLVQSTNARIVPAVPSVMYSSPAGDVFMQVNCTVIDGVSGALEDPDNQEVGVSAMFNGIALSNAGASPDLTEDGTVALSAASNVGGGMMAMKRDGLGLFSAQLRVAQHSEGHMIVNFRCDDSDPEPTAASFQQTKVVEIRTPIAATQRFGGAF